MQHQTLLNVWLILLVTYGQTDVICVAGRIRRGDKYEDTGFAECTVNNTKDTCLPCINGFYVIGKYETSNFPDPNVCVPIKECSPGHCDPCPGGYFKPLTGKQGCYKKSNITCLSTEFILEGNTTTDRQCVKNDVIDRNGNDALLERPIIAVVPFVMVLLIVVAVILFVCLYRRLRRRQQLQDLEKQENAERVSLQLMQGALPIDDDDNFENEADLNQFYQDDNQRDDDNFENEADLNEFSEDNNQCGEMAEPFEYPEDNIPNDDDNFENEADLNQFPHENIPNDDDNFENEADLNQFPQENIPNDDDNFENEADLNQFPQENIPNGWTAVPYWFPEENIPNGYRVIICMSPEDHISNGYRVIICMSPEDNIPNGWMAVPHWLLEDNIPNGYRVIKCMSPKRNIPNGWMAVPPFFPKDNIPNGYKEIKCMYSKRNIPKGWMAESRWLLKDSIPNGYRLIFGVSPEENIPNGYRLIICISPENNIPNGWMAVPHWLLEHNIPNGYRLIICIFPKKKIPNGWMAVPHWRPEDNIPNDDKFDNNHTYAKVPYWTLQDNIPNDDYNFYKNHTIPHQTDENGPYQFPQDNIPKVKDRPQVIDDNIDDGDNSQTYVKEPYPSHGSSIDNAVRGDMPSGEYNSNQDNDPINPQPRDDMLCQGAVGGDIDDNDKASSISNEKHVILLKDQPEHNSLPGRMAVGLQSFDFPVQNPDPNLPHHYHDGSSDEDDSGIQA